MIKKNIEIPRNVLREIYLANRQQSLFEFEDILKDLNTFSIHAACVAIINQERFIDHLGKEKHSLTSKSEEEKVLQTFLKKANDAIKDFDKIYKEFKKQNK